MTEVDVGQGKKAIGIACDSHRQPKAQLPENNLNVSLTGRVRVQSGDEPFLVEFVSENARSPRVSLSESYES